MVRSVYRPLQAEIKTCSNTFSRHALHADTEAELSFSTLVCFALNGINHKNSPDDPSEMKTISVDGLASRRGNSRGRRRVDVIVETRCA